jgi:hypothetical protein
MSLEIEIYMSQFKGFFSKNPDQLKILIGDVEPESFYVKIRETVEKNVTEEKSVEPTRKQILEILVEINSGVPVDEKKLMKLPFMEHRMGLICLN